MTCVIRKGLDEPRIPWDIAIDTTKAGLERLARALIATDSTLTDALVLGGDLDMGRGVSAFLRVHVPAPQADRFYDLCKPIEMKPPPRVVLS